MKTIKLDLSKFKKRSSLSQKTKLSYDELSKKHSLFRKIEDCKIHVDKNLYLHVIK